MLVQSQFKGLLWADFQSRGESRGVATGRGGGVGGHTPPKICKNQGNSGKLRVVCGC